MRSVNLRVHRECCRNSILSVLALTFHSHSIHQVTTPSSSSVLCSSQSILRSPIEFSMKRWFNSKAKEEKKAKNKPTGIMGMFAKAKSKTPAKKDKKVYLTLFRREKYLYDIVRMTVLFCKYCSRNQLKDHYRCLSNHSQTRLINKTDSNERMMGTQNQRSEPSAVSILSSVCRCGISSLQPRQPSGVICDADWSDWTYEISKMDVQKAGRETKNETKAKSATKAYPTHLCRPRTLEICQPVRSSQITSDLFT